VSIRPVQINLKECHELEDLGLCDDPKKNGVIQVMSEALHYRQLEYQPAGMWRIGGDEPWLNVELCAGSFFLGVW
jgi:ribonuclease Z